MPENGFTGERRKLIGLKARSADGKRVGKVAAVDETGLTLEKWLPLPTQYYVAYEDIKAVGATEIQINRTKAELRRDPLEEELEPFELAPGSGATSFFETGQDDEPRGPTIRVH